MTEIEHFMVEAAMQHGFMILDDDATVFRATEQQIVALVRAARLQGRQDMEQCQGCNAARIESCRRGAPSACFRKFHGGTFEAQGADL